VVHYDLWHGYRRLQHQGQRAAYPFGFGLSYSRFVIGEPAVRLLEDDGISHKIKDGINNRIADGMTGVEFGLAIANSGEMAAAEVVQVYVEPPGLLMERPRRTLVAFQRLHLQPGERRRLRLEIAWRRLACFSEARDGFVLESGRHRLVVARHADAPGLALDLVVPQAVAESYWEP
jgi:beta-glucosidase